VLGRLPDAQEPGRRRRIAVERAGGRVFPRSAGSPLPRQPLAPSPPPALTHGSRGNDVVSRAPAPFLAVGRDWAGALAPARAPAPGWAGFRPPPRPTRAEKPCSFSFSFPSFFPLVIYILIFYVPKIIKILPKSHKMIMLEFDTLHSVNHCLMYCLLPVLLEEAGTVDPELVAPEEGQEPDLPEINLLCQESFDEGKSILPLMHNLPILSTTT
jgi:hypothetical protein